MEEDSDLALDDTFRNRPPGFFVTLRRDLVGRSHLEIARQPRKREEALQSAVAKEGSATHANMAMNLPIRRQDPFAS